MYRINRGILSCAGSGLKNRVSRMSPAAWFQPGVGVTGTLTASNWADQSGNGRDLAQGTAGNQPIYLPYSGSPYAYLPGVAGNYFSTPDSAANSISGDIDIRVYAALDDWTPAALSALVAKLNSDTGYALYVNITGVLVFKWKQADTTVLQKSSTVAPTVSDAAALWVRVTLDVDNGAVGNDVKFYTSSDGSTWTQLGTTVTTAGVTNIKNTTDVVEIMSDSLALDHRTTGKCYRAQIYNGINGTLAVDFDPSTFSETSTNGATATASTGEVWTLNSTGAKPAQIVKSASFLGDGTDDFMQTAGFTLDQPFTRFIVARQITWTAGDYLASGTAGAAGITQVTGTPKIGLNAGSGVADNTGAVLGSKVIIAAVFNGANSSLQVNAATATTGDAGAGNPGGLSILSDNAGANSGNWQVYEDITFAGAKAAAEIATVRNYLAARHGIAL